MSGSQHCITSRNSEYCFLNFSLMLYTKYIFGIKLKKMTFSIYVVSIAVSLHKYYNR